MGVCDLLQMGLSIQTVSCRPLATRVMMMILLQGPCHPGHQAIIPPDVTMMMMILLQGACDKIRTQNQDLKIRISCYEEPPLTCLLGVSTCAALNSVLQVAMTVADWL
jgi:hypothetical protein